MTDLSRTTIQTALYNHPGLIRDTHSQLMMTCSLIEDCKERMQQYESEAMGKVIKNTKPGDKSNKETRELSQAEHLACDPRHAEEKDLLKKHESSRREQEIQLEYYNNMFMAMRTIAPLISGGK